VTDVAADITPFLILLGIIVVPAVIIFGVFTYFRLKRSKFHRQRITKGSMSRR
jgi:predicted cation transporter